MRPYNVGRIKIHLDPKANRVEQFSFGLVKWETKLNNGSENLLLIAKDRLVDDIEKRNEGI